MQLEDINLSYYQHNDAGAVWVGYPVLETTNTPTWQWMPRKLIAADNDPDTINNLIAKGWQSLPGPTNTHDLLRYNGQLANVLTLEGVEQLWVSSEDARRVRSMPVTLAFARVDLPDEDYRDALVGQAGGATLLQIEQMLPPPMFGELALVDDVVDGVSVLRIHNISELGEAGISIWLRMGQVLQDLASPGQWWPTTNFERRMSERPRNVKDARSLAITELKTIHQRNEALNTEQSRADSDPDAWLARWRAIQSMAHDLIALYWQAHRATTPHEIPRNPTTQAATRPNTPAPDEPTSSAADATDTPDVAKSIKRKLPDVADVRGDQGYIRIPSAWPIHTILAAYSGGKTGSGWEGGDDTIPDYGEQTKKHDTHLMLRHTDDAGKIASPATYDNGMRQTLWNTVKAFTDLDGDVFLAMLAQYLTVSPGSEKSIWLTAATILDYRGVQPIMKREGNGTRRAGHRQEDIEAIARCVARQQQQWVSIRSTIVDDGKTKSGKQSKRRPMTMLERTARLTNIAEVIWQHELLPDANAELKRTNSYAVAWRYSIGTWLEPFLQGSNRQIAHLCQQALRYDPHNEQWEKRIARYLVFQLRINKGGQLNRKIGRLLEDLHLPIDDRNPERTRARLEKALTRLQADDVLTSWQYAKDNPSLSARGWLDTWLSWGVILTGAPASIASGSDGV